MKIVNWFLGLSKKTKIITAVIAGTAIVGTGVGVGVAVNTNQHTHSYIETVTAPTCTEQGFSTYTCECGHSYVENYVNALGHTETVDSAVAPTCTETGLTEGKHCSVCDEVIVAQQTVSSTGHAFTQEDIADKYLKTAANCEEKAVYWKSCSCGEKGTDTFEYGSTTGHIYNQENTDSRYIKSEATCQNKAVYYMSCVCGEKGSSMFEYGTTASHIYDQEIVQTKYLKSEATCGVKAIYYKSCACGEKGSGTFEYGSAAAHVFDQEKVDEKYLKSEATFTSKAVYYKSCICGEKGSETFEYGEKSLYNTDSEYYSVYDGINITTLPYESNGIVILSINAKTSYQIEFIVYNNTGKPTDFFPNVGYKIYSTKGVIQTDSEAYADQMNPGEYSYLTVGYNSSTATICFGEAEVEEGETFETSATTNYNGIKITSLPYTNNGLTVTAVNAKTTSKVELIVRNDTGKAISGLSSIRYKIYSTTGYVQESSYKWLDDMDAGESCYITISINSYSAIIYFGEGSVSEGTPFYNGEMAIYSGISINKLPYTSHGITITAVHAKTSNKIEFIARNDSGMPTSKYCEVDYRVYSTAGIIQNDSYLYFDSMDVGESCYFTVSINSSTGMIKFGDIDFDAGEPFYSGEMATYNGINMNKLPYTSNGITIVGVNAKTTSAIEFIVRNDTNKAISFSSQIPSKLYTSDGIIQGENYGYLESMQPGESCYYTVSINSYTKTIKFGETIVKDETRTYDSNTTTYSGMQITTLPFESNGIAITSINAKNSSTIEFIVKNNTGKATKKCWIYYKIYNSDGIIQESSYEILDIMGAGESCYCDISINKYTSKIVFGEIYVVTE